MKNKNYIIFLIFFFVSTYCSYPTEAALQSHFFKKAKQFSQLGQKEFAFNNYQAVLREDVSSKYAVDSFFAVGEYYFLTHMYPKAEVAFQKYLKKTTNPDGKLCALAYLLKISKLTKQKKSAKKLSIDILSFKRQGFIFKDHKVYEYLSALNQKYKVLYTIDKIDFYVEGEHFETVFY